MTGAKYRLTILTLYRTRRVSIAGSIHSFDEQSISKDLFFSDDESSFSHIEII